MPEESFIRRMIGKGAAIVAAFFAGTANGFFGGGAGMLVVPCLSVFCKLDQKRAHATAIAVVLPLSVLSSILCMIGGTYSFSYGTYVGVGVVLGGVLGATLLNKIPKGCLTLLFYGVMIYAGIRMVLG